MATRISRIQLLATEIETKHGALLLMFRAFREAQVNILYCNAFEIGPGNAVAYLLPSDFNKAKASLEALKLKPQVKDAVYVEGDDRYGALVETLARVSKSMISLMSADALSIGGKFGAVLLVEEKNYLALCKALTC